MGVLRWSPEESWTHRTTIAEPPDAEPGTGATIDLAGTSVSLPLVTGWSGGK
jgi:hypothetical protein